MIDADDPRSRRAGIQQMGEADAGNLVMFSGNARIEDSGIAATVIADLLRRVTALEAKFAKRKTAE